MVWLLDQLASAVVRPDMIVVKHSELRDWVWRAGVCCVGVRGFCGFCGCCGCIYVIGIKHSELRD